MTGNTPPAAAAGAAARGRVPRGRDGERRADAPAWISSAGHARGGAGARLEPHHAAAAAAARARPLTAFIVEEPAWGPLCALAADARFRHRRRRPMGAIRAGERRPEAAHLVPLPPHRGSPRHPGTARGRRRIRRRCAARLDRATPSRGGASAPGARASASALLSVPIAVNAVAARRRPRRRRSIDLQEIPTCADSVARSRNPKPGRLAAAPACSRRRSDSCSPHPAPSRRRRPATSRCRPWTCARRAANTSCPSPTSFKLPSPIHETPQSITVVPQEVIREQAVVQPPRRAEERDRHQPRGRRGRRRAGRQPDAARIQRAQRHLPRRAPRLRLLHARSFQPRVRRSARRARRR